MFEVTGFGEEVQNEKDFLDLSCITEGVRYTRIAYVADVRTGFQKNDFGYVTFYLKDVNANLVTARLFNVEDFMLSGLKASALRKHPVKLTFVTQEYNGTISLVIDGKEGIELWNGNFPYERFVGKVSVDTKSIVALGQKFVKDFKYDERWSVMALDDFAQGRAGGFAKVFDMGLATICGMHDLVGVDLKELILVYYRAMELYFDVLLQRQRMNQFDDFNDYKILYRAESMYNGSDSKMLIVDTVRALAGIGEPVGLVASAIKQAVSNAAFVCNASYKLNAAPLGTKVSIGGVEVLKY